MFFKLVNCSSSLVKHIPEYLNPDISIEGKYWRAESDQRLDGPFGECKGGGGTDRKPNNFGLKNIRM